MTKSIAVNANNDMYRGPDGNIAFVTGKAAVMQNCQTSMQAQRGEMIYAMDQGMPTRATAWDNFNPALFEAAARKVLMGVAGVTAVINFSVSNSNNVLSYTATIDTIYGPGPING